MMPCRIKYLMGICAGFFLATGVHAESLIENVNGMTLNKDGEVIRFNAMVIDDDGKVKESKVSLRSGFVFACVPGFVFAF